MAINVKKITGFVFIMVLIMILIPVWPSILTARPAGDTKKPVNTGENKKLPVTYRTGRAGYYKQRPLISRSKGDLVTGSDIQPEVTFFNHLFHYTYRMLAGTPLEDQPLELRYRDGEWIGAAGQGWRLQYHFVLDFNRKVPVNIVRPEMGFHRGGKNQYVYVDTDGVPVIEQEQVLVGTKSYNGYRYLFLKMEIGGGRHGYVVPFRILRKGKADVEFIYRVEKGKPRLHCLKTNDWQLTAAYEAGSISDRIRTITLSKIKSSRESEWLSRWRFFYKSAFDPWGGRDYLQKIGIHRFSRVNVPVDLVFSYRAPDRAGAHRELKKSASGMWKKETYIENNSRWVLPGGMNLAGSPGLQFGDFNGDDIIDLVDGEEGGLDSWTGKKEGGWTYFGNVYKPPRALVKRGGRTPTGSRFTFDIWKVYKGSEWGETEGFQALLTGFYYPVSDMELGYFSAVYFPRIDALTGEIKPGCWDCDTDSRLALPVPLQYEGELPWPWDQPGLKALESTRNQGAQLVSLKNRLYLFYCGLCYRDTVTGQWLLAPHRQKYSENCRRRYREKWQNQGEIRRVEVYVCQGVWRAVQKEWSKQFQGESFWERVDLDKDGYPNGRFILPWNSDPYYHYHYEGFRNVEFVQLRPGTIYAVVRGRGVNSDKESQKRPEARDIYEFSKIEKKWLKVDHSTGLYPPGDFFDTPGAFFLDVNGDTLADAVFPFSRKVYINEYKAAPPYINRWLDSPRYYLPPGVGMKYYRWIDLDNDGDNDLFVLDGRTVYINMTSCEEKNTQTYMTLYTDENGKQCQVFDKPKIKNNYPPKQKLLRGVQGGSFLEKSPPGKKKEDKKWQ